MTLGCRKLSSGLRFLMLAAAILSATRFAASADAAGTSTEAVADDGSPDPKAGSAPAIGTERSEPGQLDKSRREADSGRTVVLHGRLFGPKGRAIAGARLYLTVDEWTDPVELGTSDVNGSYRLAIPEKTLRRTVTSGFALNECRASLIATAQGFGPDWEELPDVKGGRYAEMKPDYSHDFHLASDFPIAGRIVDASGKPFAGAVVAVGKIFDLADRRWWKMHPGIKAGDANRMTREETDVNNWFSPLYPTAWKMIPSAKADSDGRFQIAGVGGDRAITLRVDGPGIRSNSVSVLTRDDVAAFTQAIRTKYPRTPRPNGYFYPERRESPEGDQGVLLFGPSPTIEVDPARTIAGVVRDASTGEPIVGLRITVSNAFGAGQATTDRLGRYRILRAEDEPSISVFSDQYQPAPYLTVVRRLTDAKGLGEIVVDFNIPRGVVINGRVLESGTDRPIVSGPRQDCHDTVPGPLVAGYVTYFPLSNNAALRGMPTGLYFEGLPAGSQNYSKSAVIDGDGRFRLAVPPGPGVLLVQASPGFPMFGEWLTYKENEGLHRLFPYAMLATRAKDDGAPASDAKNFRGFTGPIPLEGYHAYRVINPPADATALDITLTVPRAPSRLLRFADPDGRAIRGVKVQGLAAPPMTIILDGSEAQVLGLEPGKPRELIAFSSDDKYTVRMFIDPGNLEPMPIRLEPTATVSGRLVEASTGHPLAGYSASLSQPGQLLVRTIGPVKTDGDGRFRLGNLIPGVGASISFEQPPPPSPGFGKGVVHAPDSLRALVLGVGEQRNVDEVRITPAVAESETNPRK